MKKVLFGKSTGSPGYSLCYVVFKMGSISIEGDVELEISLSCMFILVDNITNLWYITKKINLIQNGINWSESWMLSSVLLTSRYITGEDTELISINKLLLTHGPQVAPSFYLTKKGWGRGATLVTLPAPTFYNIVGEFRPMGEQRLIHTAPSPNIYLNGCYSEKVCSYVHSLNNERCFRFDCFKSFIELLSFSCDGLFRSLVIWLNRYSLENPTFYLNWKNSAQISNQML
jgi:hypothetical protein